MFIWHVWLRYLPEKHLPKMGGGLIRIESLGCFRSDHHHADKTKCFTLIRPKTL
jgi:hypothetical protein